MSIYNIIKNLHYTLTIRIAVSIPKPVSSKFINENQKVKNNPSKKI